MTRLLVCPQQMKRLVDAEKTGTPLVYLPLHRSHLDYLLITWTSWHFGLRLPHIAAGDNLNLNGLGWLLRATGAFFIRRRVDERDEGGKDAVYRLIPEQGKLSESMFWHLLMLDSLNYDCFPNFVGEAEIHVNYLLVIHLKHGLGAVKQIRSLALVLVRQLAAPTLYKVRCSKQQNK
ncbi:Acyltransferase [Ancylostoma duodenale]|uniref:Acyltransferase n=1 Tax=Ancylostoma duodenale TaxID=51022 RepID=A0A0C2F4P6_9BILA|nr:Acyltransferase [Ancylostoma duodenale]